MKIYIAGPYTKGDVAQNVRRSIEAADSIRYLGHTPYNPLLTHFWHLLYPHDIDYWYKLDMEWLEVCDAVFRLPGESVGADKEVARATALGKPVFFLYTQIPRVVL